MDSNEVLQPEVSDVYQKTLLSIPEDSTPIGDAVDNDFLNDFIMYFNGSRLDNVPMDASDERCRRKVIELFKEIEQDMYAVRNSRVDVMGLSGDISTLRMFADGRKPFDDSVRRSLYNVQNMSGADADAAAVLEKVYDKMRDVKGYRRSTDADFDTASREGIREHFLGNGLITEHTDPNGRVSDKIGPDVMKSRPTEVESLMGVLYRLVERANGATDIEDCRWVGGISVSGYLTGRPLAENAEPGDPIVHATNACKKVAEFSKVRFFLLKKNVATDREAMLSSTGDPYMRFLFDMIRDGKVAKDVDGPITVLDSDRITSGEIVELCNKVKRALFQLGPDGSTDENAPVRFVDGFDSSLLRLKTYVEFLGSDGLKDVVSKDSGKTIKLKRTQLIAVYILTKAVHDTFNDAIMVYSKTDVAMGEHKVPSFSSFCSAIDKACGEWPSAGIDRNYVFNYKVMFSTDTPYFPIEQVVKQNPNLYARMCQYRKSCMEAYASQAMEMLSEKNVPVKDTSSGFAERFNRLMNGVAEVDRYCDELSMSTMISATRFADAFNAVADGIAVAARKEVNDKETEYKLWSILKTMANRTPTTLGKDVKQEFVNVAYTQEDIMFRMNLAVKAGVVTNSKGFHFSGNLGVIERGRNLQAARIDRIMKIFYAYANGLLFTKTNAALRTLGYGKPMGLSLVMPYLGKVYEIAKEYNVAFSRGKADAIGCSREWSDKIVSLLDIYSLRGNHVG